MPHFPDKIFLPLIYGMTLIGIGIWVYIAAVVPDPADVVSEIDRKRAAQWRVISQIKSGLDRLSQRQIDFETEIRKISNTETLIRRAIIERDIKELRERIDRLASPDVGP